MNNQITDFIKHHYRHFNSAALIDAAEGYVQHLVGGGKMMITLAGAMSTAELGLSLAEMIRQDKVQIISCTGANLEEDLFNLVAHDFYERVPHYRDLTPADEQALLDRHMNRVTDTCIPEMEAMRRLGSVGRRYAAVSRIHRRPAARDVGDAKGLRCEKPFLVHGPAGRPGTRQLLRTPRLGLSGRRGGRGQL